MTRLTVSLAEQPEEIYIQKPAYDRYLDFLIITEKTATKEHTLAIFFNESYHRSQERR